jgi:hypothetical protein
MPVQFQILELQTCGEADLAQSAQASTRDDCVEELQASPADRGIKKAAKVDCDAEMDTVAKYASLIRSRLIERYAAGELALAKQGRGVLAAMLMEEDE